MNSVTLDAADITILLMWSAGWILVMADQGAVHFTALSLQGYGHYAALCWPNYSIDSFQEMFSQGALFIT